MKNLKPGKEKIVVFIWNYNIPTPNNLELLKKYFIKNNRKRIVVWIINKFDKILLERIIKSCVRIKFEINSFKDIRELVNKTRMKNTEVVKIISDVKNKNLKREIQKYEKEFYYDISYETYRLIDNDERYILEALQNDNEKMFNDYVDVCMQNYFNLLKKEI